MACNLFPSGLVFYSAPPPAGFSLGRPPTLSQLRSRVAGCLWPDSPHINMHGVNPSAPSTQDPPAQIWGHPSMSLLNSALYRIFWMPSWASSPKPFCCPINQTSVRLWLQRPSSISSPHITRQDLMGQNHVGSEPDSSPFQLGDMGEALDLSELGFSIRKTIHPLLFFYSANHLSWFGFPPKQTRICAQVS